MAARASAPAPSPPGAARSSTALLGHRRAARGRRIRSATYRRADRDAAADLKRTAFYFYFRDKRELLMRLTEEVAEHALRARPTSGGRATATGPSSSGRPRARSLEHYREHAALLRAVVEASTYDEVVAQFWRALIGRFVEATRADRGRAGGRARAPRYRPPGHAFALTWMAERTFYEQWPLDRPLTRRRSRSRRSTGVWVRASTAASDGSAFYGFTTTWRIGAQGREVWERSWDGPAGRRGGPGSRRSPSSTRWRRRDRPARTLGLAQPPSPTRRLRFRATVVQAERPHLLDGVTDGDLRASAASPSTQAGPDDACRLQARRRDDRSLDDGTGAARSPGLPLGPRPLMRAGGAGLARRAAGHA